MTRDVGTQGMHMALSFTMQPVQNPAASRGRIPLLVTGAAGSIGACFARRMHERYRLRLMVREERDGKDIAAYGEVQVCDLADITGLKRACEGIDTVLHLAGTADPSAEWQAILADNIIGTYHVFAAAKAAGCRRVVYASSIHAVSGYPMDVQVKPTDPVNPGDLYGVSKCFGEALGRYLAEHEGLSVIAVRIGAFLKRADVENDTTVDVIDAFVSDDDLMDLLVRAIDDRSLRWAVLHGLSDNRFKRLDISSARELLGYAPSDDTARLQPGLRALGLGQRMIGHNVDDERQRSGMRSELERLNGSH
jgi:hypothetical protein